MRPSFLQLQSPYVAAIIEAATPDATIAGILRCEHDGAEAFAVSLAGWEREKLTLEEFTRVFHCSGRPMMPLCYRSGTLAADELGEDARAELLLLTVDAGAAACDIMGDLYDPSPRECTHNPRAIEKQRRLIDQIHARGAEVLMSSHAPEEFLTGEEILDHLSDFVSRGADIPKIVVRADSEDELIEAFRTTVLLKRELQTPFVHLCVGRYARLQRYVAPSLGAALTFGMETSVQGPQPLVRSARAVLDQLNLAPAVSGGRVRTVPKAQQQQAAVEDAERMAGGRSPMSCAEAPLDTPPETLSKPYIVQDVAGYNSWPMIQALGDKLVCAYSRGIAHTIAGDDRAVYARTSTDQGKTWMTETTITDTSGCGEVTVGKGLDSTGAMLLWVRRIGKDWNHDLYRTTDGLTFTLVATPELAVTPMQITDVFSVPTIGLMSLWFAGQYDDSPSHSWGTLVSSDDGATWTQTTIECQLPKSEWPTEPSAVYLGKGRILAIARTEEPGVHATRSQFQLVSADHGATWTRSRTNIGDVCFSTPSLVLDAQTGLLSNYYYQRGHGILWRRVGAPDSVLDHPHHWPAPEAVATGSRITFDAGNVNATTIRGRHFLVFYSGEAPDTAILVSMLPAPGTVAKALTR